MNQGAGQTAEHRESLWWLAAPPAAWAVHLLLCYITAAIYCAKAPSMDVSLFAVRVAVAGYTAVALIVVTAIGARGLRHHRRGSDSAHDFDTPASRHRFLGFATLLLSAMCALAIAFAALPALFMTTCR